MEPLELRVSANGVTHPNGRGKGAMEAPKAQPARRRARKARARVAPPCFTHDIWIYRAVVFTFAATLLLVVTGSLWLAWQVPKVPEASSSLFIALASGSVGALAGLLAPSPTQR